MITGCGKPFALQGIRTLSVSFTVMVGEGFEMKCGNSEKKGSVLIVLEVKNQRNEKALKFQVNRVRKKIKKTITTTKTTINRYSLHDLPN